MYFNQNNAYLFKFYSTINFKPLNNFFCNLKSYLNHNFYYVL